MKKILIISIFILFLAGCSFGNKKVENQEIQQKSENDILSSKLDSENPPSGSEDLAQEVESKENELMKAFENKLAENFKKPDLISTSEHLEDIKLGNYEITFRVHDESKQNNWDMKVLNGNKVINTFSSFYFSSPIQVKNENATLFLFQGFSGGPHCCFSVYPVIYDQQRLKLGKELDLSHYEINGDKNLFVKDGKLYLYVLDPRFAYFYTSFAYSGIMWYPSFYRFDSQTVKLVNKNSEFKEYYQIFYKGTDEEISKWRNGNPEDIHRDWLSWLTARSVNGLIAGNDKNCIWQKFKEDFDYFVKYHKPEDLKDKTADQVKKEIEEILERLR